MHLGHSHDHNHVHEHQEHSHSPSNAPRKSKALIWRILLAASCFVLPVVKRKVTRLDVGIFAACFTFLVAVDRCKALVDRMMVSMSELYQGWKAHRVTTSIFYNKDRHLADRVTILGMWVNIVLAILKFAGGVIGHSTAMIADAGHTLSDLLSDFITLWSVQIARLPPDEDHPYGHGRFEAVGSLFLSLMLIGTGFTIGGFSYEELMRSIASMGSPDAKSLILPSWPALLSAVMSIFSKEALYRVTAKAGKAMDSQVLIANAWHHRSDAFSSVISLFAITGAMAGASWLDGVAGIFVASMISLTGLEVMKDSVRQLTDTTDQNLLKRVSDLVREVQGVQDVLRIRERCVGARHLVDMTVCTDSKISATSAHQVSERVRWTVLERLPEVAEVLVHLRADETRCPLVVGLPTQAQIENDVRAIMAQSQHVTAVSKVTVHYINMQPQVEVAIQVDPKLLVEDAQNIAQSLVEKLEAVDDISKAEVHLDLGAPLNAANGSLEVAPKPLSTIKSY